MDERRVGWSRLAIGFVVVLVVAGLAIVVLADRSATKVAVHHGRAYATQDPAVYVYMADHPRKKVLTPYVDRPLEPQLIAASHLGGVDGFELASALLLAGAAAALYLLLREGNRVPAVAGVALSYADYPIAITAKDPFTTDPVGWFCVSLGLLLVVKRMWWALAAVVLVGAMGREASAFVLLPAIGVALWDRKRPPLGFWAAMAAPVVAVAMVRYGHVFYPFVTAYSTNHRPSDVLQFNIANHGSVVGALVWSVAAGLGVAGVLAIAGFRRAPIEARLSALVLIPCALTMIIGSDWDRYLAFGLPAVVLLATFADTTTVGLVVAALFELLMSWVIYREFTHEAGILLILLTVGSLVVLLATRLSDPRAPDSQPLMPPTDARGIPNQP